ncbi:MAG: M48 family metalloprotease [Vulcanimicrobiaceae bacterium]
MRRFLIGLVGGAVIGYTLQRAGETLDDLRDPAPALEPDPAEYGRQRRAFMLAGIARSLATLGAAAYGLGPYVDPPDGAPELRARRVALVALALAGSTLLELPVDYVEGHLLERRYGLSRQSASAWASEQLKSLAVSTLISLPLIEALASTIEAAPATWPAFATAGSVPLLVLANVIAPTFIAPLFNTFAPIRGELEERIRALATRYGAGDATILRVDMSRQTEKANAYVTGVLGTRRIVVGDTLLDNFEERETLFVVAHELGHYVSKDVWRAVALGTLAAGAVFFGGNALAAQRDRSLATAVGIGRLFFNGSLLTLLAGPLLAAFSRSRERAADRFAVGATGDAQAGVDAFARLRLRNLAEDEQPRWMEVLFSSHPSLKSRIEELQALANTAAAGPPNVG